MPLRPARTALTAATAAALAAALVVAPTSGNAATNAAGGTPSPAAPRVDGTLDILVLGDSYSAGNGATDAQGAARTYGPVGCFRSKVAWGEKYAAALREQGRSVHLVNRACSGGVTADITTPRAMDTASRVEPTPAGVATAEQATASLQRRDPCNTKEFPDEEFWTYQATNVTPVVVTYDCTRHLRPQADAVTADTDLVLFTLGGNDAGFSSIVQNCFVPLTRTAAGCRARVDAARALLPTIQERGLAGIAAIRTSGLRQDAKLVQLGYPHLQLDNDFTLPDPPGYAAGDQVRALVDDGNAAIAEIATRANQGHPGQMTFVGGVPATFAGHEPDATTPIGNPQRWVNQAGDGPIEVWYHPNRLGHTAYADLLTALGTFGAPTGPSGPGTGTPPTSPVRAGLRVRVRPRPAHVGDRVRVGVRVRLSDGSRPRGTVVLRDVSEDRRLRTRKLRRSDRGSIVLRLRLRERGVTTVRVVYRDRTGAVARATRSVRVLP